MTSAMLAPQTWPVGPASPPRPPALEIVRGAKASALRHKDTLTPLAIAFGARVIVMIAASALHLSIVARHPPLRSTSLIDAWSRKDALWYLAIAQSGYNYSPVFQSRANFFPLFPALVSLGGPVAQALGLPSPYALTGMAISWVTFAIACLAIYRLALARFDRRVAVGAVTLLAVFPYSFYYGAAYTESIYLMLAVVAFLAIERGNWWVAAIAAAVASAVRPPGLILGGCVGLAYLFVWLRERRWLRWDLLSLPLIPLGAVAYTVYCWVVFGEPLAYVKTSEAGWHEGIQLNAFKFAWALLRSRKTWQLLRHPHVWISPGYLIVTCDVIYMALALLCIAAIPFIWRRMGPVYAVFVGLSVLAPLIDFPTLNSLGRYLGVLFPVFIILAYALRNHPRVLMVIAGLSLMALCGYASFFISGYGLS